MKNLLIEPANRFMISCRRGMSHASDVVVSNRELRVLHEKFRASPSAKFRLAHLAWSDVGVDFHRHLIETFINSAMTSTSSQHLAMKCEGSS